MAILPQCTQAHAYTGLCILMQPQCIYVPSKNYFKFSDYKVFRLRASNEVEMQQWVECIEDVITKLKTLT